MRANTSNERISNSGRAWATRRPMYVTMLLRRSHVPLVDVPEDAGIRRVALEIAECRRHRIEARHAVERDLRRQLGDAPLSSDEQRPPARRVDGAIGRVEQPRERVVGEIV